MIEEQYRTSKIEALILASPEPLPTRKIAKVIEDLTPSKVAKAVADLNSGYAEAGSSFRIREIAGGFQFYVLPEYEGVLESMFTRQRKVRLSRAALETVAIIAYRQPTTKIDIEHIRGVASDGVIRTLLERSLVTITGRAATVGKPLEYGTTAEFLKYFGLASLDDLPKMSEIEQMISSEEARHQTELEFGVDADGRLLKLNVADGTFDPERRERQLEELEEPAEDISIEEEPASDTSTTLVLKKGEENPEAAEVTESVQPAEPTELVEVDEPEGEQEPREPAISGTGDAQ